VLQTLIHINEQLQDRPDIDSLIDRLEGDYENRRQTYTKEALALSEARHKAADYLQKLVIKELTELAIDNGGFEFEFVYEDYADGIAIDGRAVRPFPYGLESGRFLFSANPGEPLKSLVKTASGGEISRVLLALKAAEKKANKLFHSLLVFDEVDAGIGGQTAVEVGKKLKKLSENSQLIVITHLHQIAMLADHHYVAEKKTKKSRAVIFVDRLDQTGRKAEIDRMLALPEEN
jgi:DNA repair protein RecN (Recombination protein N)